MAMSGREVQDPFVDIIRRKMEEGITAAVEYGRAVYPEVCETGEFEVLTSAGRRTGTFHRVHVISSNPFTAALHALEEFHECVSGHESIVPCRIIWRVRPEVSQSQHGARWSVYFRVGFIQE